jgi:hypothetical protein
MLFVVWFSLTTISLKMSPKFFTKPSNTACALLGSLAVFFTWNYNRVARCDEAPRKSSAFFFVKSQAIRNQIKKV